jgi:Fe-S oxidoreductase
MDQLLTYEFQRIFPGCELLDIHEYLQRKGVKLDDSTGRKYLYHAPCHDPMKQSDGTEVARDILKSEVILSDRCCSEAGTLAVARPDISTQLRFRKEEELHKGIIELTGEDKKVKNEEVKILTSCPACQQGLNRYEENTGLTTDYIVVELMKNRYGDSWKQEFMKRLQQGGVEKVLL